MIQELDKKNEYLLDRKKAYRFHLLIPQFVNKLPTKTNVLNLIIKQKKKA